MKLKISGSRADKPRKRRRKPQIAAAVIVLAVILFSLYAQTAIAPPPIDDGMPAALSMPAQSPAAAPGAEDSGSGGVSILSDPGETPNSVETPDPAATPAVVGSAERRPDCYTFLLVGTDVAAGNTDTIMVGMFNAREHKLNLVSIPRDTLVDVPWKVKKINSIYSASSGLQAGGQALKGIDALKYEASLIVGFPIDRYIVVDIAAFEKLVDSVGGVNFDVPQNMHYEAPDQNLVIDLKKGYQLLDGEKAMELVRFRRYTWGDIDRIGVQQDFLKAVFSQMLQLGNLSKLKTWANIFKEYVDTDLSAGNLLWYGEQFLGLKSDDIVFSRVPGDIACSINNGSYVNIDTDAWLTLLNSAINPCLTPRTAADLDILQWDEATRTATSTQGAVYPASAFAVYPSPNA